MKMFLFTLLLITALVWVNQNTEKEPGQKISVASFASANTPVFQLQNKTPNPSHLDFLSSSQLLGKIQTQPDSQSTVSAFDIAGTEVFRGNNAQLSNWKISAKLSYQAFHFLKFKITETTVQNKR
jgi:hypothetical protein